MNKFRFENIACPLCSTEEFIVLGVKGGGYYSSSASRAQIVRCRNCSLIYANPMPFPVDSNFLYNEEYTKMLSDFIPYTKLNLDSIDIKEGHSRLTALEDIIKRKGRILDIGCGPGNFLCVAKERGWDVSGLEINDNSARFAREVNGLDIVVGKIEDYTDEWSRSFDAVHFNQILEHTYNPMSFLKAIKAILKEDGAFFCGVPNENNIMNNIGQLYFKAVRSEFTPMLSPTFSPYHVLGFSPKTINKIFQKSGFTVLEIRPVNYSVIDIESFKNKQILKGVKSIIGVISRVFRHGQGLDVYGNISLFHKSKNNYH